MGVLRLITGALLFCISPASYSVIIDNNSYLTDTYSSLDWLDMSYSMGKTSETMLSELSTGQLGQEGWRFAKAHELRGLFSSFDRYSATDNLGSNYSLINSDYYLDPGVTYNSVYNRWSSLFDLLGSTWDASNVYGTNRPNYIIGLYDITRAGYTPSVSGYLSYTVMSNCDQYDFSPNSLSQVQCYTVPNNYVDFINLEPYYDYTRHRDAYHITGYAMNNYLIDQATYDNYLRYQGNLNVEYGSFLVRDNDNPCDDGDLTTDDINQKTRCLYQPNGYVPPISNAPEPSILTLMGLGIFGLGLSRRKLKK